jgi:hypothetical protein
MTFGVDEPLLPWGFFGSRENFEPPVTVLKFLGLDTVAAVLGALAVPMLHGSCRPFVARSDSIFQVFVNLRLGPRIGIFAELARRREFLRPDQAVKMLSRKFDTLFPQVGKT